MLERGVSQLDAAQICATAVPAAPLQQSLALMLQEELAALDGSLAQGFPSWGLTHYQVPLYAALMTAVGPERSAGPCYRCGLPSFELEQHAPARPDLKRIFTHCPACDVLFDRLQDETPVQIHGVNPVVSGSTVTRELHIANHHDTPRLFAASLFIEGDYPWFEVRFEPAAAAFEVAPGAVLIAPFEVHVHPRTAPGVYRLTAFTTSDLSWSLSVEPFVVSRPSAAPIFLRTQGGAVGGMQRKH